MIKLSDLKVAVPKPSKNLWKVEDVVKRIKNAKIIGFDIETTGLNFVSKKLISIQVSDGKNHYFMDMRKQSIEPLHRILEDRNVIKIIHNSSFDAAFIAWHFKVFIRNIWDTRLAETVIIGIGTINDELIRMLIYKYGMFKSKDEILAKYGSSLKSALKRHKLANLNKEVVKTFLTLGDGPIEDQQVNYGLDDVRYLIPLREKQIKALTKLNNMEVANLEMQVAEVTYRMRVNGINFDTKHWNKLAKMNQTVVDEIEGKLNKLAKGKVSNWNSPKQVKDYFNSIGIPLNSFSELHTAKSQRKEHLSGKSKALDLFISLRENVKYVNTYGLPWYKVDYSKDEKDENVIGPDGRVRCDFNQLIDTGRFSSSKPNLQQLPSNKYFVINHSHRRSFIPTKGYKFVAGDFSGQELGLMAAGSGEPTWIQMIMEGKDVHSHIASTYIFKDEWEAGTEKGCVFKSHQQQCKCKLHKQYRQFSKTLTFGLPYGKQPPTIAEDLGISVYEAQVMLSKFKEAAPRLMKWLQMNADHAVKNYEIRTLAPFNRRRNLVLEPESWRRRNKGYNTPIQGSGGDMLKLAMVNAQKYIDDHKYPARILLCIHDEILTECISSKAKEWSKILKQCMEDAAMVITKQKLVKVEPTITMHWLDKTGEDADLEEIKVAA